MKKDFRGRWDVENTLQDSQPDVPAGATHVMNPNGFVSQVPSGTMVNGAGGDGCDYHFSPPADGEKWNSNPMPGCENPWDYPGGRTPVVPNVVKRK